jgi:hypothetical protein
MSWKKLREVGRGGWRKWKWGRGEVEQEDKWKRKSRRGVSDGYKVKVADGATLW